MPTVEKLTLILKPTGYLAIKRITKSTRAVKSVLAQCKAGARVTD